MPTWLLLATGNSFVSARCSRQSFDALRQLYQTGSMHATKDASEQSRILCDSADFARIITGLNHHHGGRNRAIMAQGDADVGDRTQVISLERRRCVTTQRHMRHTARIIENLNLAPREIIQRGRERRTPQKITPRFKERLFAGPFGGQMDSFAIVFWRARSAACRTSRTENRARICEPGCPNCSANAATSTTSCPKPNVFMVPIVHRFARKFHVPSKLSSNSISRG